jgi:hypothetical protein
MCGHRNHKNKINLLPQLKTMYMYLKKRVRIKGSTRRIGYGGRITMGPSNSSLSVDSKTSPR